MVNKPLIRPYFWAWYVRGGWLNSHNVNQLKTKHNKHFLKTNCKYLQSHWCQRIYIRKNPCLLTESKIAKHKKTSRVVSLFSNLGVAPFIIQNVVGPDFFQVKRLPGGAAKNSKQNCHESGQIILFHPPRFPWNNGISLTKPPFGVRSCEVAMVGHMATFLGKREKITCLS